jgi:two-component system, NtrC family, sensor kinase
MKSIRGQILMLFAVCLIFSGMLTILDYANMYSLKRKMVMIENFDNVLNHILELRRFEKNFIYYGDAASIENWEAYLKKIEESFDTLGPDITQVVGADQFHRFKDALGEYESFMKEAMAPGTQGKPPLPLEEIRDRGKSLVEFAQSLIRTKRSHIDNALNRMQILPVAYFVIFVALTIIVFQLVNSSILKPLYMIRNALKHMASGSFRPIAYHMKHVNEITKLIDAFNKMAVELETRQEQLLQSRKLASIGTFTSGIAHELNNPLNNISLTAETLLMGDEAGGSPEERNTLLEDIIGQADRASLIVKHLLEFSRSEKPVLVQLDIGEVLEKTLHLVKNQLMVKGIILVKNIARELPPVRGKQQQLENAFVNIIINAIQAMPEGGTIDIGAFLGDKDRVHVTISDTGIGIPASEMAHIFDPFYTTKEVGKGTGLGLSLVYGIIHAHGGSIEVNSRVNEGTVFTIFLPIDKPETEAS